MPHEPDHSNIRRPRPWKVVGLVVLGMLAEFGVSVLGVISVGYLVVPLFFAVADTFQWWPFPLYLAGFLGCLVLRRAVRRWAEDLGRQQSGS